MSMYDSAEKLKEELKELFPNGLTFRQVWFIVKICKAVRLYCRSNIAFNNFMNSTFKGIAEFRQVERQDPKGNIYPGLSVRMLKPDGTIAEEVVAGLEE